MALRKNLVHLFIWQGSNFLVPLIVTPYLARALGVHAYGVYGLSLAIAAYGVLLTDWGFNLSAAQKVARAAEDPAQLRRLFWGTLLAKQMLMGAALAGLVAVTLAVPQFRPLWRALLGAGLTVIATSLTTNWFLQGLQRMGQFAAASLAGRLLMIPLTILFVHRPEDAVIATAIYGGTQLVSAVASLVVSARAVPLRPVIVDLAFARRQITDGWHQFASNLSVSLYVQANPIVVGLLAGTAEAGLLTSSQRLQAAFSGMILPVTLAVYPQVNRLTATDPRRAVTMMGRVLAGQAAYGVVLGLGMFIAAPLVVPWFLGRAFAAAVPVVQILALVPAIASITNMLGTNIMLPLGLKRSYTAALVAAGLVNLGLLAVLAPRLGSVGAAICSAATETFLALCFAGSIYLHRSILARMRAGERPPAVALAA